MFVTAPLRQSTKKQDPGIFEELVRRFFVVFGNVPFVGLVQELFDEILSA